jgi:signal transduction histidine kinase
MRIPHLVSTLLGLPGATAWRYRCVAAGAMLLTALMWLLALHSITGQIGKPFPGFFYNPERVVSSFTPEDYTGPQAGLRPGDTVLAVNGQHWREMPRLVQEAGIGGKLVYTVERGGERLEIRAPTMEFTAAIPLGILPGYILLSLVFVTVGVFVYLRNPRRPLNVWLLAYLLIWALGGSVVWDAYLSQTKYLAYTLLPYAVASPVAGWVFLWSFPADETRRSFLARWPLIPAFILLAAVTILSMTGLRILTYALDQPPLWRLLTFLQGWPYFAVFGLSSIPLKAAPLIVIAARPGNRQLRQQALVMIVGLVLGLTGWYLFLWAPAAIHVSPVATSGWGGVVPILYPLSIGYAILRYQMFDIRVVVRKGLIYSLLTATLTAAFLLLSLLSGYVFHQFTGQQSLLAMLLPALLVAFLFQPARSRIQAFVDHAFFRREYEIRRTLTQFSHGLSVLREREELVRLVQTTVTQTLGTGEGRLWLPNGEFYTPATSVPGARKGLAANGPVAIWLDRERRPFLPLPDEHSDPADELQEAGAVLAVPLLSGEHMVGILTLAEKRSGDPYSGEDLELLGMLAQSTALALENARLHEERLDILHRQFSQVTEVQEEERRRIARELHDGVGPSLASMRLRLHAVGRSLEQERNPAATEVEELAEQVSADIHDIRRLIDDLRPAVLDQLGLVPALNEYVARYQRDQAIAVTFVTTGGDARLPAALETALFRIAQEALSNVAKHARARTVDVGLARDSDRIALEITDDGQGFEPDSQGSGTHVGLWSMQKRVEQLGGSFTITSSPGHGARLAATFPLAGLMEHR